MTIYRIIKMNPQLKPLFNINDVIQFHNMQSYSLLSRKCPNCNGTKKISYYSADNKLNETKCNKCSTGHGYVESEQMVLPTSIQDAKISFGKITGFKIDLNNKTTYQVQPFFCDSNPLCKFFSTEDSVQYSFLHEHCDTSVDEEYIIRAEKQLDSLIFYIPQYNYNIDINDIVFFNSETHIKTPCQTCNDTNFVIDSNNKEIKCPFFTWHYSNFKNEKILKQGIITNIYYTVKLNKTQDLSNDYFKYYYVDVSCIEFNNKNNPNEFNILKNSKMSCSLGGVKNFITKNLNEALILMGDSNE